MTRASPIFLAGWLKTSESRSQLTTLGASEPRGASAEDRPSSPGRPSARLANPPSWLSDGKSQRLPQGRTPLENDRPAEQERNSRGESDGVWHRGYVSLLGLS